MTTGSEYDGAQGNRDHTVVREGAARHWLTCLRTP